MFNIRDKETHSNILASYLPNGKTFVSKYIHGSKLRKLLRGFAGTGEKVDTLIKMVIDGYDISSTTDEYFISLWEKAVKIPDECFNASGDIETRRNQVIAKLTAKGIQTDTEFKNILSLFGEEITITNLSAQSSGITVHPAYTVPFIPVNEYSRFVMIVTGNNVEGQHPAYSVPFTPILSKSFVQCIINKLKPASVKVIYINN